MSTKSWFLIGIFMVSVVLTACSTEIKQQILNKTDDKDVVIIERGDYQVVENQDTSKAENIEQIIDMAKTCENLGGKWVPAHDECEGISQDDCEYLDGTFDECASACRYNPAEQACTLQCVPVCNFE